ncbi:MAG: hypothetical protein ACRET6_12545 [Burkholderiales bacterium]
MSNGIVTSSSIRKQLAEMQLGDRARQRAMDALRDAELIVDAMIWVKERAAMLGALFPKPGFKH